MTVLEGRSNSYLVKLNSQPHRRRDRCHKRPFRGDTDAVRHDARQRLSDLHLLQLEHSPDRHRDCGAVTADTDVTLSHDISGGDYGSMPAEDVVVTVVDVPANQPTIQVGVSLPTGVSVSRETLTVPEGASNTYEVVLGHLPTGEVTVSVTVDDTANNDVTTEEESLAFTTANWNEPKTVTVLAAEDDDALAELDVTISHSVSGANYEGVTAPGLTVSITENDAVGVSITPTALTVTEGDASGVSYTWCSPPSL